MLEVRLSWEKTAVRFKVEHDAHEQILAEIKDKTSKADCTADTYFDAADYYYEKGIDLKQAAAWADKVIEKDKQYWTYQLRARIYAKLGECEKAVADAKISLDMAKKDGDDAYVKKNEQILKQCAAKSK
jgi:Tfp pilus assembly protein PilF